jgi:hypothetical protein
MAAWLFLGSVRIRADYARPRRGALGSMDQTVIAGITLRPGGG